ncbi:bifunctional (p)ppGpp synthetase/guanosine-3',5'-bis(diphosphate) 3'-pyrophosphohydrolase [Arcobacter venerupis]|uniref:Bifunctional (P)ppGpp synthetase/guanosine-3',5'-bis(Diphosphate) 3'-pyrophosphohydrolase n=1 Tax=Arcobacter venerupis TaxID=1054033 RepID=A0AAE7E3U4_9BACT|nr:HD domain-containing protein [Arcobacter venerupis]QKF67598.1 bifunctional (p)ppGpp synthetase/guanosine-3',5'-bis(diphosphate) 3'-pyrophosphohydrolase [Arcobacter venerupis]RWS50392.1 phosphohydrolase [Arcobacter venerupis]
MFSQENFVEVLNFAALAHGEQKTPKGLPYLAHITCVAMEVINACEKSSLDEAKANLAISCALLHDVIEDTNITYDELYMKFGEDVANGVEALSKDITLNSKQAQMKDSIERLLTQSYEVQMVKLADRITNLQAPPEHWDNEKIKNYQKEASFILSCLGNSNIYLANRLKEKIEDYKKYIKE